MRSWGRTVAIVVALASLTGGAARAQTTRPAEGVTTAMADDLASEVARLKAEIGALRALVPDQSHVMKDIAYHFSNLWFAGQAQNWPLAGSYLNETRSHLRWAVRIRPVRRTTSGEIDLRGILDGMDRSLLTGVQKAIEARDAVAFSKAYRDTLSGCYACHQASEKLLAVARVIGTAWGSPACRSASGRPR